MKKIKPFFPYILAASLFFAGRWTGPDSSKELEKKYNLERKYHLNEIKKLEIALIDRDKVGQKIIKKMKDDSLKNITQLIAKDKVILRQKKENEKINLSRATASELDSIRAIILRSVN